MYSHMDFACLPAVIDDFDDEDNSHSRVLGQ